MATETSININHVYAAMQAKGATNIELVLLQHDIDADPWDTTLVARGIMPGGEPLVVECCPRPCKLGQTLNPANM